MAKLGDLARLIRSKNAGAFMLTFDVMFDDEATYQRVLKSKVLTKENSRSIYRVPDEHVLFFEHDAARRSRSRSRGRTVSAHLEDGDAYGGQQHAPLVELEVPD